MNLMDLFIKVGVDDQASSGIEKISATTIAAGQLMADAISAATEKVVELGKKAVESYADYEQLVGGIETLFKESSGQVQEYASEAYKTAGLSANEYMETVTSFSASLLQATGRGAQTNLEELEGYLEAEYEAAKETYSAEYKARKETLDAEYKATKEAYDAEYDALKEAQDAEIAAYTAAADAKIAAIDKTEKEAIAAAKQQKKDTLAAMKDGNKKELTELKNANKKKLEEQKAANSKELEELKESNSKKLNAQKASIADQVQAAEEANMVSVTTLESQERAAELANQAIIDMSDNANKMGTSMESIQNAYQGFAKANYTMLDNLKLGYGGTKEEMERLIADAAKLSDTVDAQSLAFDNVVQAIHVVQTELGITGTTALEAGATISGSIGSMKAAWENLVVGMADENANIEELFRKLVVSIAGDGTETNKGVIGNLLPRIKQTFKGIKTVIQEVSPYIAEGANFIVDELVKKLENPEGLFTFLDGALAVVTGITNGLEHNTTILKIANGARTFIERFGEWLEDNNILERLSSGASKIVAKLGELIAKYAPDIISSAVTILAELEKGFFTQENIKKFGETAKNIISKLNSTITENAQEIGAAAGSIIQALSEGLAAQDWSVVGNAMAQGIKKSIGSLGSTIKGAINMLFGTVEDDELQFGLGVAQMTEGGIIGDFALGLAGYPSAKELDETWFADYSFNNPNTTKDTSLGKLEQDTGSSAAMPMPPAFEPEYDEASVPYEKSAIGQSSNVIANSFVGSGVPAGEVYSVSLDVDGETLANVLLDPLNRTAKQKGMVAFA